MPFIWVTNNFQLLVLTLLVSINDSHVYCVSDTLVQTTEGERESKREGEREGETKESNGAHLPF